MDENLITTETPTAADDGTTFSLGMPINSLIENFNISEGGLNNFSSQSQSTSSHSQTINGVTSSSETSTHTTIDSDGTVNENTVTPNMSWQDILNSYSTFQNNSDYVIGGRENTAVQNFVAKNSTSYSTNNFFDVGNRNGYLSDFLTFSGVMNFIDTNIRSFIRQNDFVSFDLENGTSFQAQTADSSESTNDIFQYSEDGQNVSYAKLGYQDAINTFTYEGGVNFYGGGNLGNVLRVNETSSTSIFLDGSLGTLFNNINNIDAGESTGDNELYGNGADNEIHAGNENNRLWGQGGNDILFGSSGLTTFLYGLNEGNDVIFNSGESDNVNLHNVSLTDILSARELGDNFIISMADGSSLNIIGQNGASNFTFGDNSSYHYDRATHSWSVATPSA